ncbi:efflux RND transporter periplasmic adaptor subunit [Caenimonas koreensis DSM 17982]|uniref:Efflux RND transporter periplasmic adaptor subunit n=1 Tax=Caenimonas koreensis DSM 17982 TaxID=1121255 RepID=A0A844AY96_9BURK|nr:efflux RND transporter periplasmic adaptor subunit [Caenimonas koreensis]MRD49335.1 efflux RND transporter periplasmic adaptor subunit [Caenimonas koreensis DSM 17982]
MKRTHIAAAAVAAVALAAGGFLAGRHAGPSMETASAPAATQPGERKVLYWHDPMVPGPRFDKPGKSPFMDMQLVPVYAGESGDAGVKISAGVQQNLGIRTATVTRAQIASSFDAVGTVQFDERLNEAVQTRVNGYVERLLVRAPMEYVRRGQPLATIYAPDWLGPQNEYLALKRTGVSEDLLAAARDRMRAMSIPDSLLRQSEQAGKAQARFNVSAPVSGVVAELGVRDGVAVTPGMTLFRIAGLERVWAVAEVPEAQAVRLRRGQKVKAAMQADSSQTFDGELKEILPQVSANTRTVQARIELANAGGRLTPGMLLRLQVVGPTSSRLVVPAEAIIRTGTRAVAIVRNANGAFEPREVNLGADLGEQLEVVQGLNEGDQVVASGQFLLDSEARLKSVLGGMAAAGQAASAASAPASQARAAAAAGIFTAEGKVEKVDAESITLSHGPIPALKWPSMTMGFSKPDPKAFAGVKPGDTVKFEFKQGGAMGYELVTVQPAGAGK